MPLLSGLALGDTQLKFLAQDSIPLPAVRVLPIRRDLALPLIFNSKPFRKLMSND